MESRWQKIPLTWRIGAVLGMVVVLAFSQGWAMVLPAYVLVWALSLLAWLPLRRWFLWSGTLGLFSSLVFLPSVFFGQHWDTILFLALRAMTILSWVLLLALSVPWQDLLAGLRRMCLPQIVVTLLGLTLRYLELLLREAQEMWLGVESRSWARIQGRRGRELAASRVGALFIKTLDLSEEVHQAMLARGYPDA